MAGHSPWKHDPPIPPTRSQPPIPSLSARNYERTYSNPWPIPAKSSVPRRPSQEASPFRVQQESSEFILPNDTVDTSLESSRYACPVQAIYQCLKCFTPPVNPLGGCASISKLTEHIRQQHDPATICAKCARPFKSSERLVAARKKDIAEQKARHERSCSGLLEWISDDSVIRLTEEQYDRFLAFCNDQLADKHMQEEAKVLGIFKAIWPEHSTHELKKKIRYDLEGHAQDWLRQIREEKRSQFSDNDASQLSFMSQPKSLSGAPNPLPTALNDDMQLWPRQNSRQPLQPAAQKQPTLPSRTSSCGSFGYQDTEVSGSSSSYSQASMGSGYLSPAFDAGRSVTGSPLRTVQLSSESSWTAKTETRSDSMSSSSRGAAGGRDAQSSLVGRAPLSRPSAATTQRQDSAGLGGDNIWPPDRLQNLLSQTKETVDRLKPYAEYKEIRSVRKVGDVARPFPSPEEDRDRRERNEGRRRLGESLADIETNVDYLRKRGSRA